MLHEDRRHVGSRAISAEIEKTARDTVAAALVAELAAAKHTTAEAILLAWILRHPAGMQPIIGTTRADRVRASAQADDITLTREEWYSLLAVARGKKVP